MPNWFKVINSTEKFYGFRKYLCYAKPENLRYMDTEYSSTLYIAAQNEFCMFRTDEHC